MLKKENNFKLPIEYLKNKKSIPVDIKNDLELIKTVNQDSKPVYEYLFNPQTELGKKTIKKWSENYTANKVYLKETQDLCKKIDSIPFEKHIIENMYNSWNEINKQNNFEEKYQYLEWDRLKWLNYSTLFLTILSFYNISSPVLNLVAPFFMLIVPFFVLKLMRLPINWTTYSKILMENFKKHAFGKLIMSFNNVSMGQKVYILFCVGMYFYNIYQNMVSCYRFYLNSYYIVDKFEIINHYLDYTISKMDLFHQLTQNYKEYDDFNKEFLTNKNNIKKFYDEIKQLPKNSDKVNKIVYVGKIMKYFYTIYDSDNINKIINYSFGFHGYIDTLIGLNKNIKTNKINKCKFTNTICLKYKNIYHPSIEKPVKNNIDMKKNLIITGPNAAGKTTLIKSSIVNLLFIQQVGFGFFDSAQTSTFDFIHCYLNIPDSCSRDSLFQSEARRCKNILDTIKNNPDKKHFCIFDELYSGKNPYEAISSAYAYLDTISKNKNVRFLLTTHFIRLCKLFKNNKKIKNKSMKTIVENYKATYTYKIHNGISTIKGGVSVLKQLNYPDNIIKMTTDILDKI